MSRMCEKDYGHVPVLLHECLDALAIKPDGIYVDGTLGRAGHSLEIVKRLTTGRLIGIDRDETAIAAAQERLRDYMDHVTLVHSNFDRIGDILADLHIDGADGMLFDLGVSSPQLDDAERGFSYMHDAPLDMRMDRTAALDARQVVNQWPYEELRRIFADELAEIQRIKSEGDFEAARLLVEKYAVNINPELHREILARYKKLNLAPYKGFINPKMTLEMDEEGEITDVVLDYEESYVDQMLRYSDEYGTL